jgi:hypothetical protein
MSDVWTDPVASLDAVTLAGAGATGTIVDLLGVKSQHVIQHNASYPGAASFSLSVEGSFDGVDWIDLGASWGNAPAAAGSQSLDFNSTVSARYVRVNAATGNVGSPVITSYVSSRD